jgi:hypothetical protein
MAEILIALYVVISVVIYIAGAFMACYVIKRSEQN